MTDPEGRDTIEYDSLGRVTREVGDVAVSVEDYAYNALGALRLNAGVVLDHHRPRLDGGGLADAAVPASLGDARSWRANHVTAGDDPEVEPAWISSADDAPVGRRTSRHTSMTRLSGASPESSEMDTRRRRRPRTSSSTSTKASTGIAIFAPTVVDGGSGAPTTIIVKETYHLRWH